MQYTEQFRYIQENTTEKYTNDKLIIELEVSSFFWNDYRITVKSHVLCKHRLAAKHIPQFPSIRLS